MHKTTIHGVVYSLLCSAAVGLHMIVNKIVLTSVHPLVCVSYMVIFALGFSVLGMKNHSFTGFFRSSFRSQFQVLIHSILATFGMLFAFMGLEHTNPTVASFIARSEVIISILGACLFLGDRLNLNKILGFIVCTVGLLAMSGFKVNEIGSFQFASTGVYYILLSALAFGSCEIFAAQAIKTIPIAEFMLIRNFSTSIFLWAYLLTQNQAVGITLNDGLLLAVSALTGPFLARQLFMLSLRHIPLTISVGINQTQALFAALFSLLFGISLPNAGEWLGGFLIVFGCILILKPKARPKGKSYTRIRAASQV